MSQGLFTAVSGIRANQAKIDVISDNLANINTAGFKSSQVTFENIFVKTLSTGSAPLSNVGGTNAMQVGLGTAVSDITRNFTGGPIQSTGRGTDLNIQGSGFFTLQGSDGGTLLSRAGNFTPDANGNLINPKGLKALGTASVTSTTGSGVPVRIPPFLNLIKNPSVSSDSINTMSNSAGSSVTSGTFTIKVTSGSPATVTDAPVTIADGDDINTVLGNVQTAIRAAGATGAVVTLSGGKIQIDKGSATSLGFDGASTDKSNILGIASFADDGAGNYVSGALTNNKSITIAKPDGSTNTFRASTFSIGKDGAIEVTYSNGDKLSVTGDPNRTLVYKTSTGIEIPSSNISVQGAAVVPSELQMQFADVVNPKGLVSQGGNMFSLGPNSGAPGFAIGRSGGIGSVESGGLEGSNVDLPTEFTEMIIAQRGVDANSRTFEAQNNIMRTIVNLGRG